MRYSTAVLKYLPLMAIFASGCARVSVDPIEVKPIHIVMDVNVRVDRELDNFFAFENKYQAPTTQASTMPAAEQITGNTP